MIGSHIAHPQVEVSTQVTTRVPRGRGWGCWRRGPGRRPESADSVHLMEIELRPSNGDLMEIDLRPLSRALGAIAHDLLQPRQVGRAVGPLYRDRTGPGRGRCAHDGARQRLGG